MTDLLKYEAKMSLQVGCKCTYESGNKCGKLLARALREQRQLSILGANGEKICLSKQIAEAFGDFYYSLYNLNMDSPE